jgi:hypothetical protein
MYVLLRNPSNRIMLEIVTWQFLLQLAQDNGWKPRGIKPIDYFSSDTTSDVVLDILHVKPD